MADWLDTAMDWEAMVAKRESTVTDCEATTADWAATVDDSCSTRVLTLGMSLARSLLTSALVYIYDEASVVEDAEAMLLAVLV